MEKNTFLNRANLDYIDQLLAQYKTDPESIEQEWQYFFEGMEFGLENSASTSNTALTSPSPSTDGASPQELNVYRLIRAYRDYGHLKADLDPLKIKQPADNLKLASFNLTEKDLNQSFKAGAFVNKETSKLKDIISFLDSAYCGTMTVQVSQCEQGTRMWFHKELEENPTDFKLSAENKTNIFQQLARTESLEKFIHTRYVGTKRFSVEGGDSLIPMLEWTAEQSTNNGIEEIVVGMAHRGRINVLANFLDKELENILSEFEGNMPELADLEGDVKYHLGYSADKKTPNGTCHLSLCFNPSHLEAVNPVAMGMVRSKQRVRKDTVERKKVLPILIHGDAAFAGQGIVFESLQLSKLEGYTVGGTVHLVINNQVGFTTDPCHSRSTPYSSDAAQAIKAPIILVNGDDAEACVKAMDLALRYRQEFKQDVVIDMICYRRFGHNEGDEPAFTQPQMYKVIKTHPTALKIYSEKINAEGIKDKAYTDNYYKEKIDNLQTILEEVRVKPPEIKLQALGGLWKSMVKPTAEDIEKAVDTKVSHSVLQKVVNQLNNIPEGFTLNSKLARLLKQRSEMISNNKIDWGMSELLAYGSLCLEGVPVRLSGQDCKRGTFTHRHSVYFDQKTGEEFSPLAKLSPDKGEFCVYNSPLSEYSVLGFEYGNSSSDPTYLNIWEAQFGDFANTAQVIMDQFISSGETKWLRMSGLVLLLPHGHEGQGPEHSSARLERFLQMCSQNNMQVCNITTPANLFHLFRRQVIRNFRKPLIVMSPKSLLRHPKVNSPVKDYTDGGFQEVIADPLATDAQKVETLIFTTGKIYYDLEDQREKSEGQDKIACVRLEQIYPMIKSQVTLQINSFPNLKKVIWLQEEPKNMGSFTHIYFKLRELMDELGLSRIPLDYIGRDAKASPATGSGKVHKKEQENIINKCLEYA